ncbi:hypothetical protein ACJJTC_009963 [Scirpophaga incertulas]
MQVASMLLGATVVTILYFTLSMRLKLMESLHVILCILGYQLCYPLAIMMLSHKNGASALMNEVDRQKQHLMLLVIGLLCGFVGGVLSLIHDGNFKLSLSPHSLTGFGLLVLTGCVY